jgi:hypothetical protein
VSDRDSDREDEQRPVTEGATSAPPPWSAEPVRHTDGQRWEASVESWSTTPRDDGAQKPSWEVPQQPWWGTPNCGPPPAHPGQQPAPPSPYGTVRISPATRQAYLQLSAAVADGFALPPLQRAPVARA